MKTASLLFLCLLGALGASGCASTMTTKQPLKTVSHVDLPKYMGDWRVIANIPYFAERGCVDSIETYHLKPDGTIENIFTFRKHSFDKPQKQIQAKATVYNKETNAEWRIVFFGFIKAKYLVIDLDPDYRWAVVGHPSRKYGWILARDRALPDAVYSGILQRLTAQGYDATKFKKVPQFLNQLPPP